MDTLSFRERCARLGRVRSLSRVTDGHPERISLSPGRKSPDVVVATLSLARRGTTMLLAKRAIESALEEGGAEIVLSHVEDRTVLEAEMSASGLDIAFMPAEEADLPAEDPGGLRP